MLFDKQDEQIGHGQIEFCHTAANAAFEIELHLAEPDPVERFLHEDKLNRKVHKVIIQEIIGYGEELVERGNITVEDFSEKLVRRVDGRGYLKKFLEGLVAMVNRKDIPIARREFVTDVISQMVRLYDRERLTKLCNLLVNIIPEENVTDKLRGKLISTLASMLFQDIDENVRGKLSSLLADKLHMRGLGENVYNELTSTLVGHMLTDNYPMNGNKRYELISKLVNMLQGGELDKNVHGKLISELVEALPWCSKMSNNVCYKLISGLVDQLPRSEMMDEKVRDKLVLWVSEFCFLAAIRCTGVRIAS